MMLGDKTLGLIATAVEVSTAEIRGNGRSEDVPKRKRDHSEQVSGI